MCICVNCRHINQCTTYLFIKRQHGKQLTNSLNQYQFTPRDTIIKINITTSVNHTKFDWDLVECLSFIEQPGQWLNDFIN